jgi:prepilin-type N-terminal cleavage/methylation domain-containing protein
MSMSSVSPHTRRGFTLAEVMLALVIFSVVMAGAFSFLLSQSRGFRSMATRAAQIQNGRFGRDIMRQEIRTAGTNVTDIQPTLVYASDSVFAFNSDLTTNRMDSAMFSGAVYVDAKATNAEVGALTLGNAITIPGSAPAFTYPIADYSDVAGTNGDAETIMFRFTKDTTSSNSADVMLVRQVNGSPAEIIATGLRKSGSIPFFRYWHDPSRFNTNNIDLDTVPRTWLPLTKAVVARGIAPDTGTAVSMRIDQVRGVEVTYEPSRPVNGQANVVQYTVPMPNTAVERQARACGRPPIAPNAPNAAWVSDSNAVMLNWSPAVDDGHGEEDAVRYVLWRRIVGAPVWGTPFASISVVGGTATYRYKDSGVQVGVGTMYQYGIAVQDCTPNISSLVASGAVVVP